MRIDIYCLMFISLVALVGCSTAPQQKILRDLPKAKQAVAQKSKQPVVNKSVEHNGSLFSKGESVQLFSDRRAYRTGDILTVKLEGGTRMTKDANTTLDKRGTISVADPVIFGQKGADFLGGKHSLAFNVAPNRNFTGNSELSRGYSIQSGYVTVLVVDVMSSGALRVEGEKWLKLNNEAEFVRLSGLVRPEDINTNNEVSSRRLADARITYSGVGYEDSVHQPGWLLKILNSPFFPF